MACGRIETMVALPPLSFIAPSVSGEQRGRQRSKRSTSSMASTTTTSSPEGDGVLEGGSPRLDGYEGLSFSSCASRSHTSQDREGTALHEVIDSSCSGDHVAHPPNQPRGRARPRTNPAKRSRVILCDIQAAVLAIAPEAEVAYAGVEEGDAPPNSIVLTTDSSMLPTRLMASSIIFLVLDSSETSLNVASSTLLSIRETTASAIVIAVFVDVSIHSNCKIAGERLAHLIELGADDAFFLQEDGWHSTITVTLAKANAFRRRSETIEKKLRASRKQCDRLFWHVAHEVVPEFPEIRRGAQEIDGKKAGNIEFVGKIGEGAFATVHSGRDPSGKSTAVKVIAKENVTSVDSVLKLANEFSILKRMKHPNVVAGYSFVHCTRNLYIFMEFGGTSTLFKLLDATGVNGLPCEQAKSFMCQIADGIAYMHELRIGHCDLKPENMVVMSDSQIQIVDMGEAVDVSEKFSPLVSPKGTMPFMAPEILELSPEWHPIFADLWSLGVLFMEMVCGNDAFIKLLGWHGKDFKSYPGLRKCAGELIHLFGSHARVPALSVCSEASRLSQSPLSMQLVSGLLKLCPEERMPATRIAELLNTSA